MHTCKLSQAKATKGHSYQKVQITLVCDTLTLVGDTDHNHKEHDMTMVCDTVHDHKEHDITLVCVTDHVHKEYDMTVMCDTVYNHKEHDITLVCHVLYATKDMTCSWCLTLSVTSVKMA